MRQVRVLGVDPGIGGGLALLDVSLGLLMTADMPIIKSGKARLMSESALTQQFSDWEPDVAWVERVHSMPKQGVASTFSFGMNYGLIRGVLAGLRVPTILVTPQEWKRIYRLGADKQDARVIAGRIFPANARDFSRVRDDGKAEAALIAKFGAGQPLQFERRSMMSDN